MKTRNNIFKLFTITVISLVYSQVYAQVGDPYSTRNPNSANDYQKTQQVYTQQIIDQHRQTSAGVGFSIPKSTFKFPESKPQRELSVEELKDKSERDALVAKNRANYEAVEAFEKPYKNYLLSVGYSEIELNGFVKLHYLGQFNMNEQSYGYFANLNDLLESKINSASFEDLYSVIGYLSDNGLVYTSYKYFDVLKSRFIEKKDTLEQLNIRLLENAFLYPVHWQIPSSLFAKIRGTQLNFEDRIGTEYFEFILAKPELEEQIANSIKKKFINFFSTHPQIQVSDWILSEYEINNMLKFKKKFGKKKSREMAEKLKRNFSN